MNPYCFLYSNALERFSQNKTVGSCARRKRLSELGDFPETIRMLSDAIDLGAFCFLLNKWHVMFNIQILLFNIITATRKE